MSKELEKEMIILIADAISKPQQCGLHIVIDDGNVEISHIRWCKNNLYKYCPIEDLELANKIIDYLLSISWSKRYKVINEAWNIE